MKPTEILSREHRVIEQVLDCLDRIASQANTAGQLDADQAALLEQFEKVEAEELGAGTHEKSLGIAAALAEKYGVQPRTVTGHVCSCH